MTSKTYRLGKSQEPANNIVQRTPVDIKLRAMQIDDAGFILDSWCSSYSRSPVVGGIDPQLFKIEQRNLVYKLIPRCRVVVACDPKATNSIRGWIALEPPREADGMWILHYCLVKYELQRRGIATALLASFRDASPGRMMFATHWTPALKWFGKDWLMFNPYLLHHCEPETKIKPPVTGVLYYGDPRG